MSNSLWPHGLYSPWNFPGKNTGVGSCSLLQGIFPTQGSNPGLPHLQADSLPADAEGKPKNTGLRSLSLLQGIFPTQESNQGLLHCRQIIYQLSYQGSLLEIKDHIVFPYIFSWDLAHWTMFYYKICYIFSWYQVSTIKKLNRWTNK